MLIIVGGKFSWYKSAKDVLEEMILERETVMEVKWSEIPQHDCYMTAETN